MSSPHSVIATAINTDGVSNSLFVESPSIAHVISDYIEYIRENDNATSIPAEFNIADNTPYNQIYTVEFYPQIQMLTIVSYSQGSTYKSRYTAIIKRGQVISQDNTKVNHDAYFTMTFANKLYELWCHNAE